MKRFPTWDELVQADSREIARAIAPGGLANNKAPRLQQILKVIRDQEGEFSLNRLGEVSRDEAYAYLTSLPGVGTKTAACVWAFGFDKPALPVDTHVGRVLIRLGLFDTSDPVKIQKALEEAAPSEIQKDLHILLIEFGRRFCTKRKPKCAECPLAAECNYRTRGETQ